MNADHMLAVRLVFGANVLVAGIVGAMTLFWPSAAKALVFGNTVDPSAALRIVGSFWLAIALLSAFGVFHPRPLLAVLVVQLLYKGLWLLVVALPAVVARDTSALPAGVAAFFLVWVSVLPFVIPWRLLLGQAQ